MKPRSTGDILQDIARQLQLEMEDYRGLMKGWFVSREWNVHTGQVTVVERPTLTDAKLTRFTLSPEDWDVLYEHLSYELSVQCDRCGSRIGTKQMAPDGRIIRYIRNVLTQCRCSLPQPDTDPKYS